MWTRGANVEKALESGKGSGKWKNRWKMGKLLQSRAENAPQRHVYAGFSYAHDTTGCGPPPVLLSGTASAVLNPTAWPKFAGENDETPVPAVCSEDLLTDPEAENEGKSRFPVGGDGQRGQAAFLEAADVITGQELVSSRKLKCRSDKKCAATYRE